MSRVTLILQENSREMTLDTRLCKTAKDELRKKTQLKRPETAYLEGELERQRGSLGDLLAFHSAGCDLLTAVSI